MAENPLATFVGTKYEKCRCCQEDRDVHELRLEPYGKEWLEVDLKLCSICLRAFNEALDYAVLQAGVGA